MYGQNPARTMSTACPTAPSPSNVGTLLPRWYLHMPHVVTATPTVVGDAVYVGAWDGTFDAIDLQTGHVRWSAHLGDRHVGSYGVITSSAAVAKGGVFVGGGDSLYALDASNGHFRWSVNLDAAHPTSRGEIESSPVVWDSAPGGPMVFVGSDANQDSGYPGEGIWAIRATTGAVVWHYRPETGSAHALYGCGNVWSSPALGLEPARPLLRHGRLPQQRGQSVPVRRLRPVLPGGPVL
jgi:outer membrane protein assembly factor BamB